MAGCASGVQRLIAALSAPTEEGRLYEVDMQLRPSGRAGPVAVQLSSFETYYASEAWTWEFMALTRIRPVAGESGLMERIVTAARRAVAGRLTRAFWLDGPSAPERLARTVARDGADQRELLAAWQRFEDGWFAVDGTRARCEIVDAG